MFQQLVPAIRAVDADDLGIGVQAVATSVSGSSAPDAPDVDASDPIVVETIRLARKFGGVIFTGPPGTSKSYYARIAALILTEGDESRFRFTQFHASYQYEDFMLGFSPTTSGFEPKEGPFLQLVQDAACDPKRRLHVLVIDELSRGDVGRIFGEALTYVERSKREMTFDIADGRNIKVPSNFIILATMNPFDRGVDEVDAAFERRFAKLELEPSEQILGEMLDLNEMDEALQGPLKRWFREINGYARVNPAAAVGHAYFTSASDSASLRDVWDYQLKYLVERAFRRDKNTRTDVETRWEHIFAAVSQPVQPSEPLGEDHTQAPDGGEPE